MSEGMLQSNWLSGMLLDHFPLTEPGDTTVRCSCDGREFLSRAAWSSHIIETVRAEAAAGG